MTAVKEIPHGTRNGYVAYKCRCEDCFNADKQYKRDYYQRNRSKIRASGAEYRANNKAKIQQRDREYRAKNKAKIVAHRRSIQPRESARATLRYNTDSVFAAQQRERSKKYREAHKQEIADYFKEYRARKPEVVTAISHRRRARKLAAPSAPYTAQQVKQRWAMWGNRCWLNPSHPAEATDHVKPLAAGGADMLANFRPICHSCNASKGAKWPIDLSSTALQRDPATAGSKPPTLTKGN